MATTRNMAPTVWDNAMDEEPTFGEVGEEYAQRLRTWRDGLNELKTHRDTSKTVYFTDAAHDNFVDLLTDVAAFLEDPDDNDWPTVAEAGDAALKQQNFEDSTNKGLDDPDGPPDEAKAVNTDPLGDSLINQL